MFTMSTEEYAKLQFKDIGIRIKMFRKALQISQLELAKAININKATMSRYERGEYAPSHKVLRKIAELYQVNPAWLLTGNGEMFTSDHSPSKNVVSSPQYIYNQSEDMQNVKIIPIVGKIKAGFALPHKDEIIDYLYVPSVHVHGYGDCLALRVDGDSMEPSIKENDYAIVCKHNNDINNNAVVVVHDHWGNTMLARYHKKGDQHWFSKDNKRYPAISPDAEHLKHWNIIGVVIKVIRDVKF